MATYITGIDAAMKQVGSIMDSFGENTVEGMKDVVTDIGSRAVERAPVETGALRGSMETEVTEEGGAVVGEIRFTEKYAARQHEHVEYKHPLGGEAKYLERAALEKAEEVREKMAAALSALFGG